MNSDTEFQSLFTTHDLTSIQSRFEKNSLESQPLFQPGSASFIPIEVEAEPVKKNPYDHLTSNSHTTQSSLEQQTKENFKHLEEDLASCRLFRVQLELSKLIKKYPHKKSGKRAQRLLDGGEMNVIDFPMKTSDNCYRRGVPDYRYSYGIYISIPEHVREGICLY